MVTLTLTNSQARLLKKLVPEMELWPGAEETPNGTPLSEEEDNTLWELITVIKGISA